MRLRTSEYGRGFSICLMQFVYHLPRINEYLDIYKSLRIKGLEGMRFTTDQGALELWFNGASDHLYELTRPPGISDKDWDTAYRIADKALDIGHGFRGTPITVDETIQMIEVAGGLVHKYSLKENVAILNYADLETLDRRLGIIPIRGEWTCPENMIRPSHVKKRTKRVRQKVTASKGNEDLGAGEGEDTN